MKALLLNPFLKSTMESLQTIAQVTVTPGKPYLNHDLFPDGTLSASLFMNGRDGNQYDGSIIISFTEDSVLDIVSHMLDQEYLSITDDVRDAITELSAMISGSARRMLKSNGHLFDAERPLIFDNDTRHSVKNDIKIPRIGLPFTLDTGSTFKVEMNISLQT